MPNGWVKKSMLLSYYTEKVEIASSRKDSGTLLMYSCFTHSHTGNEYLFFPNFRYNISCH